MIIRKAERRDAQTLFDFVLKLDREEAPVRDPVMSKDDIITVGFGPNPLFEAFIAESTEGNPLGAISFYRGYSGWHAKPVAMVHMLFVNTEARGQAIGRQLMAAVAAIVVERNWARLELFVEQDRPAIKFYRTLGLENCEEYHYRLEGMALIELSKNG